MSTQLVDDEMWAIVEPLLPPEPSKAKSGRLRVENNRGHLSSHCTARETCLIRSEAMQFHYGQVRDAMIDARC